MHRNTIVPLRVTLGVFGFNVVAASKSSGKCSEWQEEVLACGQSSNRVCVQQADPDVLRRNLAPRRGFERFARAGD